MKTQAATSTTLDDTSSITLHVVNQPIENIFKLIEKQTGLTFYYGRAILDGSQRASVSVDKASLSEVMGVLLKGKNVSWTVKDKGVVLSKSSVVPEKVTTNVAGDTVPKIDVSGVVVDVKGNPIAGASVALKGQARGQGTDAGGRFSFVDVPRNGALVISSLGFDSKQIRIGGKSELRIMLDSAIREIQAVEVVSTGYQNIPRERVNGSFVQLDNEIINRTVSTEILDRIMDVTSSLRKGRGDELTIRGFSTINANNYPLIVIDGFPYEERPDDGRTAIQNLNPNDVESITILRDAAAASIWGARSGNGVIVITTKRGEYNKKLSIQFNANVNVIEKHQLDKIPLMSSFDAVAFEKLEFQKGAYDIYDDIYAQIGIFPAVSPAAEILLAQRRGELTTTQAEKRLQAFSNHDVRDDIKKYLIQTGINQQYNINVSGGSNKISYYGSLGYDKNRSDIVGNSNNRMSFRIDNTFKPIKGVELRTFVSHVQIRAKNNGYNYKSLLADGTSIAAPYTFLADENSNPLHVTIGTGIRNTFVDTASYPALLDWHYRILDEIKLSDNTSQQYSTRLGGTLRTTLFSGFNVEFKGQYETLNQNTRDYSSPETFLVRHNVNQFMHIGPNGRIIYPVPLGGILDYATSQISNWNARIQLSYNNTWNNHSVNVLAGYETSQAEYTSDFNRKYGFNPLNDQFILTMDYNTTFPMSPAGLGTGRVPNVSSSSGTINRTVSYFGNAGYMYKNKYSATASARIDASNFLGAKANQRSIPLWSAGLGWNISEENFYSLNVFPYLKFRASYGYNGNLNNKSSALPIASYNSPALTGSAYHEEPYLTLTTPPNPGLTWEKIGIFNFGFDFSVKNNRMSGSLEYYTKRGINLIGTFLTDATRGVTSYSTNYASIKGKGFDIMVRSFPIKNLFIWQNDFNISYNTDKVTNYKGFVPNVANYTGNYREPIIGKPLQKIYSFPSAELNSKNGDPQAYLKGEVIDYEDFLKVAKPEDLIYHGSAAPKIFGNMINTFTFSGISLSFNISYRFLYYFRRPSIDFNTVFNNWGGHSDYTLRWQKPGDEKHTVVPSLPNSPDSRGMFYRYSNVLVERGDHIRLQDLRLSYDLNKLRIDKIKLQNASIYAYAANLGIIWRANQYGLDPSYLDYVYTPPTKHFAIGMSIGF